MNVAERLQRARGLHQMVMLDACTITRDTRGTLNEATGTYPVTTTTQYMGPCRIKAAASQDVDAATIGTDTTRPIFELPWADERDVAAGDVVNMTAGAWSGRALTVVDELLGTTSTCRRYTIEAQS